MTTAASLPAESQQATSPQGPSKKNTLGEPGPSLQESLTATRADLSEAQRSRSDLQDKLDRVSVDLEKLRKRNAQDVRRMNTLESQRAQLQLRLKDKDEERKGKAKLLDVWFRSTILPTSAYSFANPFPI
jgi:chromosome segregation ATPase